MGVPVKSVEVLWARVDRWMVGFMTTHGIRLMRISLAIVFIWFGLLKVIGKSPVAELVGNTVYWVPAGIFVPFLGVWETVVGLGLLLGLVMRLTLFLFWLQLAGTFLVLVARPDIAFQGVNPLLLSVEGEFVMKNLVLIAGGIVLGGTARAGGRKQKRIGGKDYE